MTCKLVSENELPLLLYPTISAMPRIDLHLHTTYSDGSFSPGEVVTMAHQVGVTTLAITDHDTTDGLPEAYARASAFNLDVIPGIEISSRFRGKETHILGYFVDWRKSTFQCRLAALRASRHSRIPEIVHKLYQLGLPISLEEVKKFGEKGSVGRPHIAQLLVAKGYVTSIKEAFERYLAKGAAAYVPRPLPDAVEVISWIHQVGGVAVLAHPSWVKGREEGIQSFCTALKEGGLQGLEVFYSTHSSRQTSEFLNLAKQLDLLMTGGSDFHGLVKPDIKVGVGRGNLKVSEKLLDSLQAARGRIQRMSE